MSFGGRGIRRDLWRPLAEVLGGLSIRIHLPVGTGPVPSTRKNLIHCFNASVQCPALVGSLLVCQGEGGRGVRCGCAGSRCCLMRLGRWERLGERNWVRLCVVVWLWVARVWVGLVCVLRVVCWRSAGLEVVLLLCLGVGVVRVWVWCGIGVPGLVLFVVMLLLRLGVLWVVYLWLVCGVVMLWLALDVVVVLVSSLVRVVLIWLVWMWEGGVRVGGVWIVGRLVGLRL